MASLAASGVTVVRQWTEAGTNGQRLKCFYCACVLSSMGGTTNTIPATAFGLACIEQCSNAVKDDNTKMYPAAPSKDGDMVLVLDVTNATDANRAAPADVSATVYLTIKGY